MVHAFAQFLAGLEMRHILGGNEHLLAGLRVAPGARRPVIEGEAAEAADLDAVAAGQCRRHRIEDHLHRVVGILRRQLREARGQTADQLGLGHRRRHRSGLVELGLEQRAEVGRTAAGGGRFGGQLLHRLVLFHLVLGLDRQIDRAGLAIEVDDHGLDRIALLEHHAQVLDALAGRFRGAQIAFDVAAEVDHGALGVHALHRPLDDAVLVVGGDEAGTSFVATHDKNSVVKGTVKSVDAKGAVIDLGGDVEGYLRASEAARERVEDLRMMFKEGDAVETMIINLDRKTRSINLSIKAKDQVEQNEAMQKLAAETSSASSGTTNLGALLKAKLNQP